MSILTGHLMVRSDMLRCKVSLCALSPIQSQGYSVICPSSPPGNNVELYTPLAGSSVKLVMSDMTQEERDNESEVLEINRDCLPKKSLPNQSVLLDFCR